MRCRCGRQGRAVALTNNIAKMAMVGEIPLEDHIFRVRYRCSNPRHDRAYAYTDSSRLPLDTARPAVRQDIFDDVDVRRGAASPLHARPLLQQRVRVCGRSASDRACHLRAIPRGGAEGSCFEPASPAGLGPRWCANMINPSRSVDCQTGGRRTPALRAALLGCPLGSGGRPHSA